MITLILISLFLLLHYIIFLIKVSTGIKKASETFSNNPSDEFVSVIIPFRNEEDNILNSLKSISDQNYPKEKYEVIYIDDNSEDNSFNVLKNYSLPENIKILKSPYSDKTRGHKKIALEYAIEKSKGEIIVTTDADCIHSKKWLSTLISCFDSQTAFVSGPVQFISNGRLFDQLQKIEFSSLILVGAGLIGIKKPIICNAANLGFRKSVFNEVGGYDDNKKISSGDDEFLMQKISRKTNYKINFCFDKNAISYTKPNKTINDFYQQRKRWASKGFYYKELSIVIKLIFIFLFYLGIPFQIIMGILFNNIFIVSAFISLTLKFLFEYKIVQKDCAKLWDRSPIKYFILAEIIHIPYIIIAGLSGIFGNYKWKGRKLER